MRKFAYRNLLFIRWMEVHRTVHIDDLIFCGYFVKTNDETNLPNPLASMDLLLPTVPVHVKARPYTLWLVLPWLLTVELGYIFVWNSQRAYSTVYYSTHVWDYAARRARCTSGAIHCPMSSFLGIFLPTAWHWLLSVSGSTCSLIILNTDVIYQWFLM